MTTYRPISARLDDSPDKVKDSTVVASSGSAKIEDAADFLVSGDDPLTYIASSITKVDSIGLIDPEFTLSFSYDEQITSDDSDLIGEGNMSIVETIYPPQGWEPSDSSVIRMYRPLQEFSTNYPLFSVSAAAELASSAFEIVLLPQYYSLEEQAINDKFGAPANGESVDSQVSAAFESAASDAYQTLVSRIYTAKTIRPQRLTISNIEDSGQESSTQISISTTSTTEAAYTP